MNWLWHIILCIIAMETVLAEQIEESKARGTNYLSIKLDRNENPVAKGAQKVHSYSRWNRWGACQGGRKIRRRHCLRRQICGRSLRIEIARCKGAHESWRRKIVPTDTLESNSSSSSKNVEIQLQVRQLDNDDVQKKFRGFSPWGPWSSCSRKCTTVRKRAVETMPPPALAIHPEDTRVPRTATPECGRLGRIRGPAARMRARMRDMIRIIGGRPAPPGKWPWQVAVLNRYKEAFCGGTLVALRWAVTAAHCVRKRLYVRLGEHDLLIRNYGELEMKVTEAVTHPRYDPDTVLNDVAMLRLPVAARPDLGHGLACLPPPRQTLPPHTTCVILGWGKKRPTDIHGTRILQEAQVSTIQQGVCRRSYWQYAITDNMVCAGRGRRDSCAGDSGGPLLCRAHNMRYYLQGITSFGDGCGKRGKYGIYTRTAGYVAWMHEVMSKKYFD